MMEQGIVAHHLSMDERSRLTLTGVEDVVRFDEGEIVMNTCAGTLTVLGEELHIEQLSLDGGEVRVSGRIESLSYADRPETGGFFSRLLKG